MPHYYTYEIKAYSDCIRMYALDEENKTVAIEVSDFSPTMYYEISYNRGKITKSAIDALKAEIAEISCISVDNIKCKSLHTLYYVSDKKLYIRIDYPSIVSYEHDKRYRLPKTIEGFNVCSVQCNVPLEVQFTSKLGIQAAGWIDIEAFEKYDDECLKVSCSKISFIEKDYVPTPCILSFDIEAYSSVRGTFSEAGRDADAIFQISCVFSGSNTDRILIGIGEFESDGTFETIQCKTELELLDKFFKVIKKYNPNIITGWNIYKFDFPYIIERYDKLSGDVSITCPYSIGVLSNVKGVKYSKTWKSSAYGTQSITFIELPGRIILDLFVYAQREFKRSSYKLDSFGKEFLNSPKVPVSYSQVFDAYEKHITEGVDAYADLSLVAKYCVHDSVIVSQLFDIFQAWTTITEMGSICNVPPSYIYIKGQQIKVFAQVYKYCYDNDIVIDTRYAPPRSEYVGATVLSPTPGLYEYVVPFDFKSLYPTIMIAYNIDYMSYVKPGDASIPDDECTIVKCGESSHRFYKKRKGVLPSIADHLLNARDAVRKRMKTLDKSSVLYNILNLRQLSYKVSCNSLYGAMGVREGMLPLLPGAEAVTSLGRDNLTKAADYLVNVHGAVVVYGDTDSCYVQFPKVNPDDLWNYATEVQRKIKEAEVFPKPMLLEFEEAVYDPFLSLTKKRYMWKKYKNGVRSEEIGCTGAVMSRRDNCKIFRDIYEHVVRLIFDKHPKQDIIYYIVTQFNECMTLQKPLEDFIVTKNIKTADNYVKYNAVMKNTGDEKAARKTLDGHIQMAYRMVDRGEPVEFHTRQNYLITNILDHSHKLGRKIESVDFVKEHDFIQIDYIYYFKWFATQIDQVLEHAIGVKFVKEQVKVRKNYYATLKQLRKFFNRVEYVSK